jgi:hypothetical protein
MHWMQICIASLAGRVRDTADGERDKREHDEIVQVIKDRGRRRYLRSLRPALRGTDVSRVSRSEAVMFYAWQMDGSTRAPGPRKRRKIRAALLDEVPLAEGRLCDLPAEIGAIVREAVERIEAWTPKGVHFGWEKAFKNKGKFPAVMSKAEARALVRRLVLGESLKVFANRRDGLPADGEFRIVVNAGEVIGTRGQRALRIVLARAATGYVIDNAFPVLSA